MQLSVIILNYNVRYFLELCIQSVSAAISNLDAEIIVVDNNSTDESCQMIQQKFPQITLIQNKENYGFSKGNNIAVAQAKGEYVCILNPDTVVAEDTFESVLKFAETKTNIGIVGCRLIDGKGDFLPESKRHIPTPSVSIKKMLGLSKAYYNSLIEEKEVGENSIFVGAFMLIKREVYNEVKGFDEDYFMYGEDIDLSYKILKAGYKNYYFGKTTIIHYKGESTLKDAVYAKRFYGAMQIFYKKHFKNNKVFDVFVWLGIQFAKRMHQSNNEDSNPKRTNYILVSKEEHKALKKILNTTLITSLQSFQLQGDSELVFDANVISFKDIIKYFSNSEKNIGLTFKILPKNSNFILGSNSSKSRGEIITF